MVKINMTNMSRKCLLIGDSSMAPMWLPPALESDLPRICDFLLAQSAGIGTKDPVCIVCLRFRDRFLGLVTPYGVGPLPDADGPEEWTAEQRASAAFG